MDFAAAAHGEYGAPDGTKTQAEQALTPGLVRSLPPKRQAQYLGAFSAIYTATYTGFAKANDKASVPPIIYFALIVVLYAFTWWSFYVPALRLRRVGRFARRIYWSIARDLTYSANRRREAHLRRGCRSTREHRNLPQPDASGAQYQVAMACIRRAARAGPCARYYHFRRLVHGLLWRPLQEPVRPDPVRTTLLSRTSQAAPGLSHLFTS